jgi:hypothetical protein
MSADAPPSVPAHFLADHARLEALLEQVLALLETDDRERMLSSWAHFCARVFAHMEAEETCLISPLLGVCERDARVLLQEHRHIRARLKELSTALRLRAVRVDSLRSLVDELGAHARSEERLLYRWADARLDESARAAAIEALTARRTP